MEWSLQISNSIATRRMNGNFFDSNVLIYVASELSEKANIAESLLLAEPPLMSAQVLNECAHVLRRKLRHDWIDIVKFIERLTLTGTVRAITVETTRRGLQLAERYRFSVWDSMIVASALEAGAEVLWTEDMHDGLVVDGQLRIANPFVDLTPPAPPAPPR